MTKQEFLKQLQIFLNSRLGSKEAAPHISYYQEYIEIEVRKGRKEEDVISELGNPQLIGKSIKDAAERKKNIETRRALGIGKKCAEAVKEITERAKQWFEKLQK